MIKVPSIDAVILVAATADACLLRFDGRTVVNFLVETFVCAAGGCEQLQDTGGQGRPSKIQRLGWVFRLGLG